MLSLSLDIESRAGLATIVTSVPATWNPADKSGMTLSNGNLTAANTGGPGGVRASRAIAGKVYAELVGVQTTGDPMLGVTEAGTNLGAWLYNGAGTHSVIWYGTNATIWFGGGGGSSQASGISNLANGDVGQIAIDTAAGKIWFGNGNTWNGNPAAGTGGFSLAGTSGPLFIVFQGGGSESVTANFGGSSYAYTPPAGFGSL